MVLNAAVRTRLAEAFLIDCLRVAVATSWSRLECPIFPDTSIKIV